MILVILTALTAVCGAAKLDKGYLPPISAKTAGGSPGAFLAPLEGTNQGFGLPSGSYTNDAQGVVVDAVNPGTRTTGVEPTGLGGPRASYGSTDSKVGDAAFSGSGIRNSGGVSTRIAPGFGSFVGSEESEAGKTRGNTLKFATDVGLNNYSYGFETDNGISVGENGVAENGVQAQGGYSYKGDDDKTYQVTYTADEDGFKPQGHHLPTPPPIPDEILKSLEKNAKEEAAGLVDDGSYDPQKYNDGGDYSSNGAANNNARPTKGGGAATGSGSFVTQGNQAHRPSSGLLIGAYNPGSSASQSSQTQGAQGYGNKQSGFGLNKDQSGSQGFGFSGNGAAIGGQFGQASSTSPQANNNFGSPIRTPSFNSLPGSLNENSAFSSAVSSGFGSASAFASTSSSGYGLKNENFPLSNNFGSADQYNEGLKSGSDSSVGASYPTPSTAVASASVSGTPTFGQQYSGSQQPSVQGSTVLPQFPSTPAPSNTKFGSPSYSQSAQSSGANINNEYQSPNLPSSASASASVSGDQPNIGQVNQHFNNFQAQSNQNSFPSRFGQNQQSGNSAANSEYLPPLNIIESTGVPKPQGFESSSTASDVNTVAKPSGFGSSTFGLSSQQSGFQSEALNSKPSVGLPQFGNTNTQFSSVQPTKPTLGFGSISTQGPTKVPATELTTPFESKGPASVNNYQTSNQASNSFTSGNIPVPSPTPATSFLSSQQESQSSSAYESQSKFPSQGASGQYKPTISQSSFPQTGPSDATFASSTQQAALSQQQGNDDSYYYKQPSKPFVSPLQSFSSQFDNRQPNKPVSSSQQGSNYPNAPTPSTTGTLSSSSYNNGVTQAAISPFPTGSPSSLPQFPSQSNQFGSKPTLSTQFGQSSLQGSSQFVTTGAQQTLSQRPISQFDQKPTVQSQTQYGQSSSSQNSDSSLSSTQQYQGTIYQYNKPAGTLPTSANTDSQPKPSQISTESKFGSQQVSSQFSGQSIGSTPVSTFQQTQTAQSSAIGSQSNTLFGQKPNYQGQFAQFGQKPLPSSQTTGSNYQQSQFGGSGTIFNQKPQTPLGSTFSSNTQGQQSVFGNKPTPPTQSVSYFQQTTPSSGLGSSFVTQKPSSFVQKPFGNSQSTGSFVGQTAQSSTSPSQGQSSQFNPKPVDSTFQKPQFGSQSVQGNGFSSSSGQTSFGQKPIGSSYPQSQFGTSSQYGQSSQAQGSSLLSTAGQSSFGQKPSTTKPTGSTNQQFGSTNSQFGFGQKPQSAQGSYFTSNTGSKGQSTQSSQQSSSQFGVTSSFGQKPAGSYQQSQFGTTGSQFGQKPQISQGSSSSTNTLSQTQTSVFGKKPTSNTQSAFQQTQFGSTTSQFGQNSQAQGSGLFSSGSQSSFGQKPSTIKPIISTNQQFGSTNSQFGFGQKPQSAQGSYFTSGSKGQSVQNSQFGVTGSSQNKGSGSSIGSGSSYQQTQFSSFSGTKFGQKPQTTLGTASQPSTQFGIKPFGSTQNTQGFQQTQFGSGSLFGQTSQSSQGKVPTSTTTAQPTQFGIKPVSQTSGFNFQNNQFGSSGSVFGQKPLTTQVGQKPSTTFGSYNQFPQFGSQSNKPFSITQTPFLGQFSSTTGQFGKQPQAQANAFASSSGPEATKFGSTQSSQVSKYQETSQYGVQGQKPVQSSLSQTNYQQSQYTQTSGSQTNVGSGQIGGQSLFGVQTQKPAGSQFGTFQTQLNQGQKPFGSSQGSAFQFGQSAADQKTQPTQSSISTTNIGSQSAGNSFGSEQSADGYNYNKPQTALSFASQFGGQANSPQDQKVQSTQTSFNSEVSNTQTQIGVEPIKPFGSSSAQGSYQNAQSSLGSTQFGVQPTKGSDSNVSPSQFSGKPFQPASTVSTQSSSFQSDTSSTAVSQFGLQPTKPALTHFSGQPFKPASTSFGSQSLFGQQSSQSFAATTQKPSQSQFSIEPFKTEFSSTPSPSFPSSLGSNPSAKPEGYVVSTLQTPIVPVPGYEINTSTQGSTSEFGGPRDPPRFDDKTGYYY